MKEKIINKVQFRTSILYGFKTHKVILIALAMLMTMLTVLEPNFMTQGNLFDIVRVISIKGVMAIGMTMVLLTGGIDLSIGSTFALCGAVASSFIVGGYSDYATSNLIKLPTLIAILIAITVGAMIGLINGLVISKLKIEPFIATLAMMIFARGLTYLYTGGYPINFKPMPDDFAWFGKGYLGILPAPSVIFIITILIGGYILRYTSFGRSLLAIGGNSNAARLSGVNVKKNICFTYMLMGALAAIAGIIMSSRVASASPIAGETYEMDVIAGVVLGGTIQGGGKGSIIGTVIGVFYFGVIENGLNILGLPTYYRLIIKGLIIIVAIGYNTLISNQKSAVK